MTVFSWLFFGLYLILSVTDIYSVHHSHPVLERHFKPLLMPCLLAVLLFSDAPFSLWLVLALVLGFLGDTLLMFPKLFMPGLFAFLAGHVCYTVFFLKAMDPVPFTVLTLVFLIPYIVYLILTGRKLLPSLKKQDMPGVFLYMLLILAMSFSALLFFLSRKTFPAFMALLGSVLFIASDTMLAFRQYRSASGRFLEAAIMITYLAAQGLIIFGYILL